MRTFNAHLVVCVALCALTGPLASAGEISAYDLVGRRDGVRSYESTLEVEDLGGDRVRLRWQARGEPAVLETEGQRRGPYLQVRFPLEQGARGRLLGEDAGRVLGFYRIEGDSISGVLLEEGGDFDWRFAIERGKRAPKPTGFEPAGTQKFKRVVLCIDGIPHTVMSQLKAQGRFPGFRPPARMVTVYPSLSAMSWGRLLGMPPEVGYQVEYYSNHLGKVMGATSKQMLTQTMRAETRMHHRHHGLVGHALAYVFPFWAGRRQIKKLIHELREHEGSRTAFLYAYQSDAIAHMMGREKLVSVLDDIEKEIASLQKWYRDKHGEELEIVIVSDHGHTLVSGELVAINEHLEKNGWKLVEEVRKPRQVNFSSAGILSSIALHCQPEGEPELAKIVSKLEGVDLCTYDVGGHQQFVVSQAGVGRFDYTAKTDSYSYTVVEGRDPIGYQSIYARLAAQGKLDAKRRATSRDLFAATADYRYPDAPHRIRLGHKPGALVKSPANVIVSLKDGFENARGMVKKLAKFSPSGRSGTHGSLNQTNSVGIFMTNFLPTIEAIRPEDLSRLIDTRELHANRPPVEVVAAPGAQGEGELRVEAKAMGDRGTDTQTSVKITVRRKRFLLRDPLLHEETFQASDLRRSQGAYQIPTKILGKLKEGKKYRIKTLVERTDGAGKVVERSEHEVTIKYRGANQVFD